MAKLSKTFLSLAIVLSVMLGIFPAAAFAVTQEEINAVRARRDAISRERQERQSAVEALAVQQAGVLEQKAAMDDRNALTLEQIDLTQQEIALYGEMIEEKQHEADAAHAEEILQLARYRKRVRAMEENGRLGLLSVILHTESLGAFFTVADDIGEIMRHDREVELAWREAKERSEQARAELEGVKTQLERRRAELEAQQRELQAEMAEAEALIVSLQSDIDSGQAEVDAILADEYAADAELQRLMAELERQRQEELERQRRAEELRRQQEEQARQEEAARQQAEEERLRQALKAPTLATAENTGETEPGTTADTPTVNASGSFLWPVPGHTTVTSRFGLRVHPVTGVKKTHTGLDIAADTGTLIVAADGGTVQRASVYGGYGNCVVLDHGNGYVTLYGHMSRMTVSEGETVAQGQSIGTVGSTGVSTGPHCHFEIWSGGTRIDPESFFSGLSFSESAGE